MKLHRPAFLCAALVLALTSCQSGTAAPASTTENTTAAVSGNDTAEITTTTASVPEETTVQTTTTAETTDTAEITSAVPEQQSDSIPNGVYWAHCGAQWGDRYYEFNETGGAVINQESGIGAPFTYELDGEDIVFHFFSADDNSPAKLKFENGYPTLISFEFEGDQQLEYMGDTSIDELKFYNNMEISAMMRNYLRATVSGPEPFTVVTSDTANELIETYVQFGDGSTETYYVDRFTSTCTDADGNILMGIDEYLEKTVYPKPWDPAVIQQQVIFDNDAPLGAAFLGRIEWFTKPRPYYDQILEQLGWTENMDCLAELPDDRIAGSITGQQLYLIVPQQPDMSVVVWKKELNPDGELENTTELYYSDDGAPFLLKCNSNEIYPDVCVEIYTHDGQLSSWTPQISGESGHIVTALDEPEGGSVYDMTIAYAGDVQSD